MLARLRKSTDEKDQGFTLIELLVVMIIIGILAAIAVPVFLSQRSKAQDTAAKADVASVGKEIATYFVDNTVAPASLTIAGGRYVLQTAATSSPASTGVDVGKNSSNVTLYGVSSTAVTTTAWTQAAWCVGTENLQGSTKNYRYSAQNGLEPGKCASATAPVATP